MRLGVPILRVVLLTVCASVAAYAAEPARPKSILVTGASTGIGRRITEHLAAEGYLVYAGARKDSDLRALASLKNVQPMRLDVTSQQDIRNAVARITAGGHGLYGLVNNAGVGATSPILSSEVGKMCDMIALNVTALTRLT